MEDKYCSIKQAAEILGVSEATLRRKVKRGQVKAELVQGLYGPEYRVERASLYPSSSVTEVVRVEQALSLDDIRMVIEGVYANGNALLIAKIDEQAQIIMDMQEQLAELDKKLQNKKESWWNRLMKGG